MREIKFRALRLKIDYWEIGSLYVNDKGETFIDKSDWRREPVRPETVCQFTGLLDKNGVEIYEGDVVRIYDSAVGEIKFFYGAWQIQNGDKAGGQLGSISIDHIEVIGNVFENLELLGGKE